MEGHDYLAVTAVLMLNKALDVGTTEAEPSCPHLTLWVACKN